MVDDKEKLYTRKIAIDLTGPEGNAFVLLAYAKQFAKCLGKDASIITKMQSGDLVKVFEAEFGDYFDLYRGRYGGEGENER